MASIHRQGKKYSVRFRHNGRNHRATVSTKSRAEHVRQVVENTIEDLSIGRYSIPDGVEPGRFILSGGKVASPQQMPATLHEACSEWVSSRRVAETTHKQNQTHIEHLLSFFSPSASVRQLDFQGYASFRLKSVSAKTLRKELVSLSSLLKAVGVNFSPSDVHLERDNATDGFQSLDNATDGHRVLLTIDEVTELRRTVRKLGSRLIADAVDCVAFTAARRSEVCRLKPSDVSLDAKTITITELKRKHGSVTKRVLPIHSDLLPILTQRSSRSPLFTKSVWTLTTGLKRALRGTRFEIKGFGFHALRHSAASRLLAQNVPVTVVADILGHSTPQTTLNVYAHAFDEDRRKAMELL